MCSANEYVDVGLPMTQVFGLDEHGSTQNMWLTQSDNGLIYVATGSGGLNEWDGEQWRFYPASNKSGIRCISQWTDNRLYVGMQNDIGYYQADANGVMTYHSLLDDWSFEQRQFGEIFAIAANKHGVMFTAYEVLLFWDGRQVSVIDKAHSDIPQIFALGDRFIYKPSSSAFLYEVQFEEQATQLKPLIVKTDLFLPEKASVRNIFLNAKQQLVVFTATHGIYQLNNTVLEQKTSRHSLGDETSIYNAIQASDGYYYAVSPYHGVFVLDEELKPLRQYTAEHNLGVQRFYHVMEDHQGNIWLSGRLNVIKMLPPHTYSIYQTDTRSTGSGYIGLIRDKVTVAGDGLFQLTPSDLPLGPSYFKNIRSDKGFSVHFLEHKNHLFYSASQPSFVAKITSDAEHETSTELAKSKHLIDFGRVFATDPDTDTLFTATHTGLYQIEYQGKKPTWHTSLIDNTQDELNYLEMGDDGIIWAGTATQELYRIENAQHSDKATKVQKFTAQDGLAPGGVIPFKLNSGIVFGTGDGLMDYQHDGQPALDFVKDLPEVFSTKGQEVTMLYEDTRGRIWYQIGEHSGYIVKNDKGQWQTREDIFSPFANFPLNGVVTKADNIIWFTLSSGAIYRLNIEALNKLPSEGRLNIRQVNRLHDDSLLYGGLLQAGLKRAFLPELDQQSNGIRIHYALADNTVNGAAQYRHRLLGSGNDKWSDWSSEHYRDFTELKGANYQFELEAKDGWGRIQSVTLPFTVLPPWYLSKPAWIVYILFGLLVVLFSSWLTQRWRTAKLIQQNIKLEQQVAFRTQEVQDKVSQLQQQQTLKDRFFANVSHEFRTPLTLIVEPLNEVLRTTPNLRQEVVFAIDTALRNSKKMLGLVGQVLDINKLESGRFPLRIAQYDLADLANQIVSHHSHWAKQHQQRISLHNTSYPLMLYYDQDQMEKCISNLLSNGIKYGGENCHISVSLLVNHGVNNREDFVGIEVMDTGPGINVDAQEKVFERFYQTEQSETISEPGTGIGLALVKELMELHQGDVELITTLGKGCCFILWLKRGSDHFDASQFIDAEPSLVYEHTKPQSEHQILDQGSLPTAKQQQDITTILVVDDNAELRQFISTRLKDSYRVIQATNGKEGLALARSNLPDLIIADVMMPLMDGFEMTQSIKSHKDTCTIPILLLTAKSTKRETVEGFQAGADDYLSKPFDTSELIVRASRLINAQKVLRKTIIEELSGQDGPDPGKKKRSFEDKVQAEIHAHLSDPDFDIDSLCNALSMSRSSLNRKCQKAFGNSAGQHITELRMQTALILLSEGTHSVSEIAYGTGYESLAYFSRVFKKHFGQSPTELKK